MDEQRKLTISCGWWGPVIIVSIIAIMAFQTNAEPMSDWSFKSWCWIAFPILWPLWVIASFMFMKTIALIVEIFSTKTMARKMRHLQCRMSHMNCHKIFRDYWKICK